ncbi:MAG: hypothetical protein LBB21_06690 [Holosporaceae bacterium]|jgi:hypothetical protein|nr:hypothetical protein [Holosporaceae bacterium]
MVVTSKIISLIFMCVIPTVCDAMVCRTIAWEAEKYVGTQAHESLIGKFNYAIPTIPKTELSPVEQRRMVATIMLFLQFHKTGEDYIHCIRELINVANNYVMTHRCMDGEDETEPWITWDCSELAEDPITQAFFGHLCFAIKNGTKMDSENEVANIETILTVNQQSRMSSTLTPGAMQFGGRGKNFQ